MNKELSGIIRQWNDQKGFGFIKGDDGSDVFFHITSLRGDCRPHINDRVFYIPKKDEQARIAAAHVRHFELKVDNPKIRIKPIAPAAVKNLDTFVKKPILQNSKSNGKSHSNKVRHLPFKLVLFIILLLMPMFGATHVLIEHKFPWILISYIVFSVITFYLYWSDKQNAGINQRRTPEIRLHFFEFIGGWIGALIAQQMFRHKTRKLSYQIKFWLIVGLHQAFWLDRLFFDGRYAIYYLGV